MDLNDDELLTMSTDAAEVAVEDGNRDAVAAVGAVLAGSGHDRRLRRHDGWSRPEPSGISPLDAFIDTAAEFGELLDSLDHGEWAERTRVEGATVRGLVDHLVGMERYLLGQLGRGPSYRADRREDHWPVTRQAAADLATASDDEAARQWWLEVLRLVAACSELGPDHPVRYHHLPGSVHGLLVSRTFELWTHADDIRQAVGRPLSLLDDDRLSLMVGELMGALPIGVALTGQALPGRSARFELEGPGGGTFDVALSFGEDAGGTPDIVIATNTIDLCRLAANRLDVDELEATVDGDHGLLEPVLVAATAFAAD
jgi:uncharacterized protein (TIGR03083 family)